MAGESPDKSEQRKSSGETAPGERDPRLAVFREAAARRPEPGGSDRVDQPTAVFKLPPEASPVPPASPATEAGAESTESAEKPEGDARLRAAVAAWVATADSPEDARAAAEDGASGAQDAGAGRDGAAEAAEAGTRADGRPEGARAATAPEAGADGPEQPSEAPGADDDAKTTGAGGEAAADSAGPALPKPAAEPLPAAGASARAERTEGVTAADEDAEGESATDEDAGAGSRSGDDAPGAGRDGGPSDSDTGGLRRESAGEARSAAREPEPAEAEARVTDANANTDADADANANVKSPRTAAASGAAAPRDAEVSTPSDGTDDGTDEDTTGADDAPATGADAPGTGRVPAWADSGVGGGRTSRAGSEADAAPTGVDSPGTGPAATKGNAGTGGAGAGRAAAKADPGTDADTDTGTSTGTDAADDSGEQQPSGGGSGGGVDQATAVFKAVRPRQAVDQPTTALKAVTPESAAERTSKFVPLKRDDIRPPAGRPRSTPAASTSAAPPAPAPAATPAPVPEAERTRQQPLPPKPPLDLLAELTNTPPPPETPVRTAVRRVKIWTPLVLLVVIVFTVVQFLRPLPPPTLALTAEPTYTFEGDALDMPWPEEGQSAVEVQGVGSIGTHGEQKPWPIASVTKAMTAYVILKEHPLTGNETGPKITVDAQAEKESKFKEESTASIREGQQFTERQMLQLLMVPSGNNAARLLARWDAKSEEEFVRKMNDAAKDLGMKNTTYTDPSGLKATTVSTATDQLKLAKAVMENDVFREIVNLPEVEIPGIDGKIYNNNNILLQPGVSGIKTGSSTPAGGNLLWSANTVVDGKERRIVGAVMGQEDATTLDGKLQLAISRSLKLIQAAQRDVTSATVVKKGEVVGYVDDGLGGRTPVVATKNLKAVGWPGLKVELTISDAGKPLPHTAKAGDEVGQVTVGSGPGQVKAPVALKNDLVEPGVGAKLTRVG
ncbi:hypothetical protein BGM19_16975 [Streptomyces agglomeratus]|uniref:serine hydrolase n=1 Tax=Streptomyces agglomeratus TaxID=285458 RepID=UPI00086EA3C7|nr:serine hydrolase [Streptomyces agglomeratus]OEJ59430.1 hypothetical protein BGM19_16975 [Streptomyces agglomeratus]